MAVTFALTGCKGSQSGAAPADSIATFDDSATTPTHPIPDDEGPSVPPAQDPPSEPTQPVQPSPLPEDTSPGPGEPTPPDELPPATAGVTLSWLAPTENTDGSALTDLSGFIIHYGTQPTDLTSSIVISTPGMLSYFIDGLASGTTYYFAVTATARSGAESALSEILATTAH